MSMFAALARKWHYSVENPDAGRLVYREGNHEFTFPFYEENGGFVLVAPPSSQRIHLFFNWHAQQQGFSRAARERILPRIERHLRSKGARVRVFERAMRGEHFEFYPELFDARGCAAELLQMEGYTCFHDYGSIDLLHGEYGLEVCGIQNEHDVGIIAGALRRGFPHWHHENVSVHEPGHEPGWSVALSMFPAPIGTSDWQDGD